MNLCHITQVVERVFADNNCLKTVANNELRPAYILMLKPAGEWFGGCASYAARIVRECRRLHKCPFFPASPLAMFSSSR